jgi:amino acid adenylation domain-containing protein
VTRPAVCPARFADVVRARPGSAAVIDGGAVLSYAELDARTDRIAGWLQERGAGPEDLVAVLTERTADLPAAVLGVWKAGAAYLALDPQAPRERLRAIARQLHPKALVTSAGMRARTAGLQLPTLVADEAFSAPAPASVALSPDNLAYVIHTSGSTGTPKGVAVSHRALLAVTRTYQQTYGLGTRISRVLQLAGFGFDVATGDIARTMLTGAALVMCPAQAQVSPPELSALIRRADIQYAEVTPSLLRPLVSYLRATGERLDPLRYVIVGGELWTSAEYQALRDVLAPHVRLVNTSGLTEAAIDSTAYEPPPAGVASGGVPIGRPIRSTRVAILDAELSPADEGELYVAGDQLARGYLGDPATTAQRFVPTPVGPPGARAYRTGDLVARRPDGELIFSRRADDLRKINGVRVSLAEVQLVLARHPAIRAVAVDIVPVRGRDELVAYLVPAEGEGTRRAEIRRFAAAHLPPAAVPSVLHTMPGLPVTPSGKVDRAALRASLPGAAEGPGPDEAAAPPAADTTGSEGPLRGLVARHLGVSPGPDEDFFELGGDSLRLAALATAVRTELGVDLPPSAIYAHPTLAVLALLVNRPFAPPQVPVLAGCDEGPLAPGQHRLWLLHQLDGGLRSYNVGVAFAVAGELDTSALAGAWQVVVDRHGALRTAIVAERGGPRQQERRQVTADLAVVDVAGAAAADDWTRSELRGPFDLDSPPLARATLLRLPGPAARLVITAHHLVCDGASVRTLLDDLGTAYRALRAGNPCGLAVPLLRYLDYSVWQQGRLSAGEYDDQLASLLARLDGAPPAPRLPGPRAPGSGEGRERLRLDRDLTQDLRSLAREHRTTLFVAMLACFAGLLCRWTGQDELVLGVPFGDRRVPGTEPVIGFFVDTAVLRLPAPADATFGDLARAAHAATAHAAATRDVPFDVVHHHLRRAGTDLDLTVWFNFLGPAETPPDLGEARVTVLSHEPPGALFDVNVYVTEAGEELDVEFVLDATTVDAALARELAGQYAQLLAAVIADPGVPVSAHRARARRCPLRPPGRCARRGDRRPRTRVFRAGLRAAGRLGVGHRRGPASGRGPGRGPGGRARPPWRCAGRGAARQLGQRRRLLRSRPRLPVALARPPARCRAPRRRLADGRHAARRARRPHSVHRARHRGTDGLARRAVAGPRAPRIRRLHLWHHRRSQGGAVKRPAAGPLSRLVRPHPGPHGRRQVRTARRSRPRSAAPRRVRPAVHRCDAVRAAGGGHQVAARAPAVAGGRAGDRAAPHPAAAAAADQREQPLAERRPAGGLRRRSALRRRCHRTAGRRAAGDRHQRLRDYRDAAGHGLARGRAR